MISTFFRILLERKYFGAFTERAFWIEMIKIDAGAKWLSTSEGARRLIVALSGGATVNGTEIGQLTAIQADAGETLHVSATEETVLYIVGLPPVQLPSTPSDQFDVIESHVVIQQSQPIAAAIQFENPNAGRPTVPTARKRKRSFKWRHSMKNALFSALLVIFAAVAATPATAQRSGATSSTQTYLCRRRQPALCNSRSRLTTPVSCGRVHGRCYSRTHPARRDRS